MSRANAYNCIFLPLDPEKTISGHIFEGTVVKASAKKSLNPFQKPREKAQFLKFEINKIWNGNFDYLMNEDNIIEVFEPLQGGGGCPYGFGFEEGKKYLVRLQKNGALMQASAFSCTCSWSSELESDFAKQEINTLKKIKSRLLKNE
ncbi:MAG: hypothetical protein AB8B83_05515 [Bdellovibrionales bacterium]